MQLVNTLYENISCDSYKIVVGTHTRPQWVLG